MIEDTFFFCSLHLRFATSIQKCIHMSRILSTINAKNNVHHYQNVHSLSKFIVYNEIIYMGNLIVLLWIIIVMI